MKCEHKNRLHWPNHGRRSWGSSSLKFLEGVWPLEGVDCRAPDNTAAQQPLKDNLHCGTSIGGTSGILEEKWGPPTPRHQPRTALERETGPQNITVDSNADTPLKRRRIGDYGECAVC